jgi:hypothetical protein
MLQEDVVSVQQGRKFSLSHGICVGARSQMKKFPWKSKKTARERTKRMATTTATTTTTTRQQLNFKLNNSNAMNR